jgi:uncharacterized protein YkwD/LysM repeat protein
MDNFAMDKNRRQKIVTAVLLIIFLLLTGSYPTKVEAQGPATEIFNLINQFRANNGLPPFQYNATLAAAAQNQANYMAANTIFSSHVGEGGSTPQTRANAAGYSGYVVENIVGGTGMTPSRGLNWWINSPVHYNTLITQRYTEAGTAYATNGSENFYVLVVGRRTDAPPAPASSQTSPEPLIITPIELAEPAEDGSITHIVQEGQALWSLAAHYDVKLSDLLLYNGLTENSFLQPGQEIIIRLPDGAEPPPTPTPPLTHVVEEGQTLWSIAVRYNLRLADLLWYNNLTEDSVLQPGETLIIRLAEGQLPPPTPTPILMHTVRAGQTLWEVALTYGLTLDELLALNGLTADSIIQPGEQLLVRQPDPTATPMSVPTAVSSAAQATPSPTPTLTPTAVSASIAVPSPTAAAVPTVATPQTNGAANTGNGRSLIIGLVVFGVGMLALAVSGIVYLRKQA